MLWTWAQPLSFSALAVSGPLSSASLHRYVHQTCSGLTLPLRSLSPISSSSISLFLLPSVLSPFPHPAGHEAKENGGLLFSLPSLRKKPFLQISTRLGDGKAPGGLCLGWHGTRRSLPGHVGWVWTETGHWLKNRLPKPNPGRSQICFSLHH